MSSPVITISERIKVKNQNKREIGVGSVVNPNVGELEGIKREGRISRRRKKVVGCVHDVVGKKNFLVQFEDGENKGIICVSLSCVCSKEGV